MRIQLTTPHPPRHVARTTGAPASPTPRPPAAMLLAGVLAAGLSLGLTACGSSDQATTAPTTTTAARSTTSTPTSSTSATSTTVAGTTTGSTPGSSTTAPTVSTTTAPAGPCPSRTWSTRRKVAQLVMVGVDPEGTEGARTAVTKHEVGGIFVRGANGLFASGTLQTLVGPDGVKPFVATDEEGGRVQSIDELAGPMPSARVLGTKPLAEITQIATDRGKALATYGVTVDFAPDVDVSAQQDDEVIGDRSFSNDPQAVIRNARAFAEGLRAAGILPVFKHFPGHGHAVGDSHKGTSTTPPLSALGPDLAPFRTLLPEPGAGAVMIGHLVVPGLSTLPASLSPAAIDGLLRTDLGYQGLVFTDDLGGMKAVTERFGPTEAVRRSLAAGADVALLAQRPDTGAILTGLEQAVKAGTLPMARVDDALGHVLRAKGYDC